MTKKINVMAIQMSSVLGDKKQNIEKIKKLINNNAKPETDIIFLPEVWTVGWACEYFPESAETLDDSEVIRTLSELAKTHNVNIVGGSFITKKDGKIYLPHLPLMFQIDAGIQLFKCQKELISVIINYILLYINN